jgi:two-component system, OmpR family, sensor histidine kinase KdpD
MPRAHENGARRAASRKTPEEYLRELEAEDPESVGGGDLKVFLGYASGVGKSLRMLDEARRRRQRGQDVVVGAFQSRVSPEVQSLLDSLEVVPLKTIGGGSAIDVEAIVRRRPAICVIDGLAHDNPPGARNRARWQDVRELLDSGIKVITSINVQYVEELREQVLEITGKRITETVPVAFIKSADEIEIIDAPVEETAGGAPDEEAQQRRERFARLREMALVIAADVVDFQLNQYLESHGIRQRFGAHERILVCVTPRANLAEMLAEARIVADCFHADLVVAYVKQGEMPEADRAALDVRLKMAKEAGAQLAILEGADPAAALLDYARSNHVTQLFVGHSGRGGLARLRGSPLDKLIWGGQGMDVRVFPQ